MCYLLNFHYYFLRGWRWVAKGWGFKLKAYQLVFNVTHYDSIPTKNDYIRTQGITCTLEFMAVPRTNYCLTMRGIIGKR